jgi:hypothetical protein
MQELLLRRRSPAFVLAIVFLLAMLAVMPARAQEGAQLPEREPDEVITGTITAADHQRYLRAPFTLPEGTERLVVAFDYDRREDRTVIDLGIDDPNGFRGASGGNKASFTIAQSDATPSYLAGPLPPGEWALAVAVPNIREGVSARWSAKLWFLRGAEAEWLPSPTKSRGPGWFRGDLHLHTGHSDASCDSQSGERVPCPLFRTMEQASERGLDFVAVTEHNTSSHAAALRELSPYFDRMLIIPAREVTTFYGHFNVFGITSPLDFRIAPNIDNSFERIADEVHARGGIVAINHPRLPSGEICMGCGWTMPEADLAHADAVEAVNGASSGAATGGVEGPVSGIPFWLDALRSGKGLTAIGSSDNHDPSREGRDAIGAVTTVVFAADLTQAAILQGIRDGRAFIDMTGTGDVHLDFVATAAGAEAAMGGDLPVDAGTPVRIAADVAAPAGATLELRRGGELLQALPVERGRSLHNLSLPAGAGEQNVWLALRDKEGALLAMSNAVRITPTKVTGPPV